MKDSVIALIESMRLARREMRWRRCRGLTIRERVVVGGTVPADVELREVPSDWGPSVSRYRYYHTDSGVYFVDPADRRVIYDLN
jgi:hypothetical protein